MVISGGKVFAMKPSPLTAVAQNFATSCGFLTVGRGRCPNQTVESPHPTSGDGRAGIRRLARPLTWVFLICTTAPASVVARTPLGYASAL
jgi:hypothetical protein